MHNQQVDNIQDVLGLFLSLMPDFLFYYPSVHKKIYDIFITRHPCEHSHMGTF